MKKRKTVELTLVVTAPTNMPKALMKKEIRHAINTQLQYMTFADQRTQEWVDGEIKVRSLR